MLSPAAGCAGFPAAVVPLSGGDRVNSLSKRISRFALLTALSLVLGLMDRAVPLSALLGGAIPGIRLGLANTVLLYAVYLMDRRAALLLMLVKVLLSGFLFGSLSAILYSLSGGVLSLAVMLAFRRRPVPCALVSALSALAAMVFLLIRHPSPRGQMLWCILLTGLAALAGTVLFFLLLKKKVREVISVSMAGAIAHNAGQMLVAAWMLQTPRLLLTYLPVLVGIGAAVGCLTGVIADRVFSALRYFRYDSRA